MPHSDLWRRWREERDYDARDDLLALYRHLAPTTVARLIQSPPPQMDRDEAHAEAMLGLLLAIERFNPERGSKFESFAVATVRGVLLDWLKKQPWSGRQRVQFSVSLDELGSGLEEVVDPAPSPEDQAFTRLEYEAFDTYQKQLAIADQLLLNEIFRDGDKVKDVAARRGRKSWWVRRRVNKLLVQLRDWFEKGEEGR